MGEKYQHLQAKLAELRDLGKILSVLGWDQQVKMPPAGAPARARQIGTLSGILHEKRTSDELGKLIEEAGAEIAGMAYDSDEASTVRVAKRDYDEQTCLPTDLVVKFAKATTAGHEIWAKARENNDYKAFQPTLEHIIDLTHQIAEQFGYVDNNPYNALLHRFEKGSSYSQIKAIFDGHRAQLVDLVKAIGDADTVDDSMLHQAFDKNQQRQFSEWIVAKFGYDFERGRLDETVHPFATSFSVNDVRITTRYYDNFLNPALFGSMHEAGHAMYEMGVNQAYDGTTLAGGTSQGVHESQSRLWENLVGRSYGFWQWAYPELQTAFPQLKGVDVDSFYRAINVVKPSYIRVEADEATYNLHIMLRFELENDMMNGKVNFSDLPNAWNERFEAYLGVTPPDDSNGVLQDVHWSSGLLGYFPTYALGNLLSVQYYNQALQDHPTIPDEIQQGQFKTLFDWLGANIHTHGRKFTASELTKRVTGEDINSAPYIDYLTQKYSRIYGL